MSTYAARIENGIVAQVIVGTPEWAKDRLGGMWIASATKVGVGWQQYADGLRPPAPYPSWTWNGQQWQSPVPYPDDGGMYQWDETAGQWVPIVQETL